MRTVSWLVFGSFFVTALACAGPGGKPDPEGGDTGRPADPPVAEDLDGDGYDTDSDCDDGNATVHPGASEVCDPSDVDEDCDGLANAEDPDVTTTVVGYADADGDGYGDPTAAETLCELGGGFVAEGTDCDDTAATVHPGGREVCGADDEDCDGLVDDADDSVDASGGTRVWPDVDGDGYGDAGDGGTFVCVPSAREVDNDSDCDDGNVAINPDGIETCDGEDQDCDGRVDDGATDALTWYLDDDGDGYGDAAHTREACDAPADYVSDDSDCDDGEPAVNPGAVERCDDADDDCDGTVDAGAADALTWYRDADGDGYGVPTATLAACDLPAGYAAVATDCDDASSAISPAARETCDAANTDEDCDGLADDLDSGPTATTAWYPDTDGDGYGYWSGSVSRCDQPSGYVSRNDDCNDYYATAHPGASEVCDEHDVDEDCDGRTDDDDSSVDTSTFTDWYFDFDHDGFGGFLASTSCDYTSASVVTTSTDCDDSDSAINTDAVEVCDDGDTDEDCDGYADDADSGAWGKTDWYVDLDGDGYGAGTAARQCDPPTGYVAGEDCDDTDPAISPDAQEICFDAVDEDCDGSTDCELQGEDALARITHTNGSSADFGIYADLGDLDGDGWTDLVVSSAEDGTNHTAFYLFRGPLTGDIDQTSADASWTGSTTDETSDRGVLLVPDQDGDGQLEIATVNDDYGAYLFSGETSGAWTTADARTSWSADTGGALDARFVGDPDHDGADEVAVGLGFWEQVYTTPNTGNVLFFDVNDTGAASEDGVYPRTSSLYYGYSVDGGRDINGDGLDDLAVGAIGYSSYAGKVYFYTSGDLSRTGEDTTWTDANTQTGYRVRMVEDLDGDGYDDTIVGSYSGGAYIVAGDAAVSLGGTLARVSGSCGQSFAAVGDVDADGSPDLAFADTSASDGASSGGAVYLHLGPFSGTVSCTSDDLTFVADSTGQGFGYRVYPAGDADSDGYDDLAVAASSGEGGVVLFAGSIFGP